MWINVLFCGVSVRAYMWSKDLWPIGRPSLAHVYCEVSDDAPLRWLIRLAD